VLTGVATIAPRCGPVREF